MVGLGRFSLFADGGWTGSSILELRVVRDFEYATVITTVSTRLFAIVRRFPVLDRVFTEALSWSNQTP